MNAEDYEIAKRSYARAEVRKYKREIVVKLLKKGVLDETVKEYFDLTDEELAEIKASIK